MGALFMYCQIVLVPEICKHLGDLHLNICMVCLHMLKESEYHTSQELSQRGQQKP